MNQRGFVLASLLITTTFVVLIGVTVAQLVVNNYKLAADEQHRINAQFGADTGLDYSIAQLNIDNTHTGTGGEVTLMDTGAIRVTYETTISDVTSTRKTLSSTGRTYVPASATDPKIERAYSVDLRGIGPLDLGTFSIVTGVGGLIMENQSKVVAGDVFVNGEIIMSGSSQIGLASTDPADAVVVRAAHQICPVPADGTYPRVCTLGENGEPISISNPAQIYGEVQAHNQITGTRMSNPGLVAGSPAPEPLPVHDRASQILAATNIMPSGTADCDSNSGSLTILANTRIEGDVSWQKKCEITIEGDLWITGNLTMANTAEMIVADTLITTMPTLMVDGPDGAQFRNSSRFVANSSGTGAQLITYHSAAACSPDCPNVTGADLALSRDEVTITMDQSFEAPESILYARWSQILIENSGDIGALLGQTVRLQNSTTVTFGTSVIGGGGGLITRTWLVDGYKRVFD